ncbi:MAG: amidohydrolase [Eubacteriales bacterium]|nr:amidohydrolase [Eubacteriales bacterium]
MKTLDFSYLDYAFVNGTVITMDSADSIVEAVGIKGNQIVCVGTQNDVLSYADKRTKRIDLGGHSLIPGLIDSHFHPILYGLFGHDEDAAIINTNHEDCQSIEDILFLIAKAVKKRPKGTFISMMGYDQNRIKEKRHITLNELDLVAPDHPVQCMRTCGHICVYNSCALALIGVNEPEDAKQYPENEIVIEDGRFTGVVKDHTHFYLWSKANYSKEEQIKAALKSNEILLKNGITSIHDPGEFGEQSVQVMQTLCKERLFKPRTYMMLHSIYGKRFSKTLVDYFLDLGLLTGIGDDYFRLGSCKFMIDGGTSGPSCATRDPYDHDPKMPGILAWDRTEVADYIKMIHDAGCQATAHAVGDLAIEFMVEGYERAQKENPRENARHRIEHCSIVDPDLIERMARLGLCPSLNPGFLEWNGVNYTNYFGKRMQFFNAQRSMIDAGIRVSIGSDAPSGPVDFAAILDAAVNRIDRTCQTMVDQTQKITLMEALRLYTINGAYASFEEKTKGSIECGKLADLVVLSEDITKLSSERIRELSVELTMLDGNIEYQK